LPSLCKIPKKFIIGGTQYCYNAFVTVISFIERYIIMKHLVRFLTLAAAIATLFTFTAVRPAAAACTVLDISNGQTGMFTFVQGHSYTFTITILGSTSSYTATAPYSGSQPISAPNPGRITIVDNSGDCGGGIFWNPGDGRADPQPGDRIAVYCNLSAPQAIGIYGIDSKGNGVFLANVSLSDITNAGEGGFVKHLGNKGTVFVGVGADGTSFWAAWQGPYGANASGAFAKEFTCNFPK
jgi:hypothetical protein